MTQHKLIGVVFERVAATWTWLASGFRDSLPAPIRALVFGDETILEIREALDGFEITERRRPGANGTTWASGTVPKRVLRRLGALSRRRPVHLLPRDGDVLTREVVVPAAAMLGGRDMVALNFETWTAFSAAATAHLVSPIAVDETTARLRVRFVPMARLRFASTQLAELGLVLDSVVLDPASPAITFDRRKARRINIGRAVDGVLLATALLTMGLAMELGRRNAEAERDGALEATRALLDEARRATEIQSDLDRRRAALDDLVSSLTRRETATAALAAMASSVPAGAQVQALDWSREATRAELLFDAGTPDIPIERDGHVRYVILGESETGRRVQMIVEGRATP